MILACPRQGLSATEKFRHRVYLRAWSLSPGEAHDRDHGGSHRPGIPASWCSVSRCSPTLSLSMAMPWS